MKVASIESEILVNIADGAVQCSSAVGPKPSGRFSTLAPEYLPMAREYYVKDHHHH